MEQDFELPVEIIVHDDASTDGSADYIKQHFPDIRLLSSDRNVGFCVSNNRMVAVAEGKYVLLLNNDAELLPDALRTYYEYAEAHARAAILGIRQYAAATGELIDFGIFFDPFLNSVPNLDARRRNVGMVMGACIWIPKRVWDDIGGFPDWFQTMHEDMWICCMARLRGYPVRVIPQSGYRHWVGQSLGGGKIVEKKIATPLKRRFMSERNRIFVMAICYPAPVIYIVLPLHLVLLLLEGMTLAIAKRKCDLMRSLYWAAIKAAWAKRRKLLHLRRAVQTGRRISACRFLSAVRPLPHKLRMLIKHGLPEVS